MKKHHIITRRISSLLLAGSVGVLSPVPAAHAGNTWTGGGASTNWSDSNNWGGAQPTYGTLTFTTGGTQGTTSAVDQAYSMNQLLWTGTSSWILNNSGGFGITLFDNGGAQAKIENQSTGTVTINAPITFAANNGSPANPFGEINAVSGDIAFGTGTLTVNGSSVNGIRMFGGTARTVTFNNTVSASGKYFALIGPVVSGKGTGTKMTVGGAFTSGDIYLMNGSSLNLAAGSITTSALRLGGDFGTTTFQDLTKGGTFNLTAPSGGLTFASTINTISGNTSGTLAINSQNTSGANALTGGFFLDSNLQVSQTGAGGVLNLGTALGQNTISFQNAGSRVLTLNASIATTTINVNHALTNVADGSNQLIVTGSGTTTINSDNSGSGANLLLFNPQGGTLAISAANNLGSPVVAGGGYPDKVLFGAATGATTSTLLVNGSFSYGSATAGSLLGIAVNKSTVANTAVINVSGANVFTMNGALSDFGAAANAGSWRKDGTGTLTLNAASGFVGSMNLNAGTLNLGNSSALGTNTFIIGSNSSFDATAAGLTIANSMNMNGGSPTFIGTNSLTIGGAATMTGASRSITVTANTLTISGGLLQDGTSRSFTKLGAGTLVLNGTNTYAGTTTLGSSSVTGGTLVVGGGNALANSVMTMGSAGGSKLVLGNANGMVSQTVTYTANTIVSTGNTLTNSIVGGNASNSSLTFNTTAGIATVDLLLGGAGTNENNFGVTITGAGTTRFQGQAETYNGDTTINAGATLSINLANVLPFGVGKGNVIANGTLAITIGSSALNINGLSGTGTVDSVSSTTKTLVAGNNDATSTFGGILKATSGGLALTKVGTGTLTLTGANTYGGVTTINSGGTLRIGDNASSSGTPGTGGNVVNAGTLAFNRNDAGLSVANVISGAGAVNQVGSGTSTLTGANSFTGSININAGILAANRGNNTVNPTTSALGNPQNGSRSINVNNGGTLRFDNGDTLGGATSTVLTPIIVASGGAVTNNGTSFNTLGPITLNGGTLTGTGGSGNSQFQMYRFGGNVTVGGTVASTISLTGAGNATNGFHLSSNTTFNVADATSSAASDLNVSGALIEQTGGSGAGGLTKTGAGTMTLSGVNTYTGTTAVSGGVLALGAAGSLADTSAVNVTGSTATFDISAISAAGETIGSLAGVSGSSAVLGGKTLTAGGDNTSTEFAGAIGGAGGSIVKAGSGTWTLSGPNTFTGTTTVLNGTLQLNRLTADNSAIPTDANTATTADIVIGGGNLVIAASEQIGDTGSISMSSGSLGFSGSGLTENINKLTVSGGTFTTGANTLIVGGATVTWSGGTNTISTGGLVSDKHWVITGGTNTVQQTGLLRVQSGTGTVGLFFGGTGSPTITLDSDGSNNPGEILLRQNVTVDSTLTSGTAQILSGGSASSPGAIDLDGGTRTFSVNNGSAATDLLISASIQSSGAIIKADTGTLTLTGANTFTGSTTINAGTLEAGAAAALGSTVSVTVNTGGTLLLSGSGDRINNAAAIALAGGTFDTGGLSETVGVLTLTNDSIIDFGGGASILTFADSSAAGWGSFRLSIYNWSGNTVTGAGTDQLRFTGNGLTTAQLSQIDFYTGFNTGLITGFPGNGFVGSFGEVVPVPEPSSVTTVVGLLGLVAWRERRKARLAQQAVRAKS